MPSFQSRLQKQLVRIGDHIYINPGDPLYYEKVLRYMDAKSPEAHYRLGQKYEQRKAFSHALFHYRQAVLLSPSPHDVKAKDSIRRIENVRNRNVNPVHALQGSGQFPVSTRMKYLVAHLCLCIVVLLVLLFGLL